METIQKDLDSLIRKGKKLGCLSKFDVSRLSKKDWRYPNFKFRVKTHKEIIGIRLIIGSAGGPFNNIEGWIKTQIKGLEINNAFIISNADDLIKDTKYLKLRDSFKLASLDVTSMFTSIPHGLITDTLADILKEENKVNSDFLMQTINLVLNNNFFKCKDKCYRQVIGLPMGNKISPILANVVMTKFDEYLSKLNGIIFYKRYVDDTFLIYNEEILSGVDILNHANEWNKVIKFTLDGEENRELNFLDLTIIRNSDKLKFKTYKKKVNSELMINAKSAIPGSIKNNALKNYFLKVFRRTTDNNMREAEINEIKKIAKFNGYSNKIIERTLSMARKKGKRGLKEKTEDELIEKKKNYFGLQYHEGLFERLNRIAKKVGKFNLAPIATNRIKDKITTRDLNIQNDEFEQGIVYKIECSCNMCYIGETGRRVLDRMKEHKADIKYCRRTSALAGHLAENKKCEIVWDKVETLTKCKELFHRKFLENEMILKFKGATLNQNIGVMPNVVWNKLLKG